METRSSAEWSVRPGKFDVLNLSSLFPSDGHNGIPALAPTQTIPTLLAEWHMHMERQEHRRFSAYLADGREWFRDTPEVTNLIEAMARTCHGWERLIDNDEWWRRKKRTAPEVTVSRIA